MFDVVVVVRVPGVAHKWIRDVWEERVEEPEWLGEDAAHVDMLVHHEGVGAHVVGLHDPVEDTMEPGEMVVQIDRAGDDGGEI